jgi:carotenoid cleavage dioxygenase-like enzyme
MELDSLSFILALKGAAQSMSQRLDVPSRLHLVPRRNGKKAIQLDVPPFFCVHTLCPGMETK